MNKKISIGVSLFLMAITATVTFAITWVFSSGVFNGMLNTNVTITKAMYDKIDEIDKIVRENYNGEIDETLLLDSISKGYAYGLGDFYANYYSAEEYSELKDDLNGKVVGIGVDHVKDAEGYARITSVYEDSPAQIAGLQKNDQIVKISDIDVLTDYNNAVNALKGDAGTTVKVTYRRAGEDTQVEITRRKITVPTVETQMLDDNIAYIKITDCASSTVNQFEAAVSDAVSKKAAGIIFDIRNNGGGTMKSVAQMLDILLPEGPVILSVDKSGKSKVMYSSDSAEVSLPMAVVMNKNTGSAAELFAAALQDYDKAELVGTVTYGKGVMQDIYPLTDGSAIKITTAKFNPPKSENFNGVGVKPDYTVTLTAEQEKLWYELDASTDTQLIKAISVVKALNK
ncbi:MAG: PDZ domain-containing protein [Oscillospiraceae bacterium]|nr:PDZ domain-containing protein [Oscillospiraceae bacterium]MBQ5816696.1 PDZ domain-containing protein [Oscillospiraceae bacterium]